MSVVTRLKSYLARRQGLEPITYPHPSLKSTLERTLGVPLFQEQLLKIAMDIAGFSGSEAEELRRAMGFKRPDRKLEQIEKNLRAGMTRNDIDQATQDTIVTCVKAFANYGFPESHAYSFALLAYASAYFMVHYRACFMTAMFNNYPLGFYSAATLVKDAQRHGLHFLPMDINRSDYLFTVEESEVRSQKSEFISQNSEIRSRNQIQNPKSKIQNQKMVRVGLKYVRGLREEVGLKIIEERDHPKRLCRPLSGEACLTEGATKSPASPPPARGIASEDLLESSTERHSLSGQQAAKPPCDCISKPYTSIEDLIRRVPEINKREIRALSLAGALNFDGTVHRRQALWESEVATQPVGPLFDLGSGNSDLGFPFGEASDTIDMSSNTKSEIRTPKSQIETGFLTRMEGLELVDADLRKTGISIGKHPMAFVREEMRKRGILSAAEALDLKKRDIASVAGAVIIRQRPMTANNVVFITLEDETGFSNFVVMPDMFERFRAVINQSSFLIIRGICEDRGMIKALHFTPLNELKTEVVSHDFR